LETIIISGAQNIGKAAGISWKNLPWYIKEKGLPAFQIDNKGPYMAIPDDLRVWAIKMRDENLVNR